MRQIRLLDVAARCGMKTHALRNSSRTLHTVQTLRPVKRIVSDNHCLLSREKIVSDVQVESNRTQKHAARYLGVAQELPCRLRG